MVLPVVQETGTYVRVSYKEIEEYLRTRTAQFVPFPFKDSVAASQ